MNVMSFVPVGYDGELVSVEVDIRHGLPGTEIVGLPGADVREARDRVRVALANSGFIYPPLKILVSLSPADVPKFGAGFDLAIAVALLCGSKQIPDNVEDSTLAVGELLLDGRVRPARGVLSAVAVAYANGIKHFTVAREGAHEAKAFGQGRVVAIAHLRDLPGAFSKAAGRSSVTMDFRSESPKPTVPQQARPGSIVPNFGEMRLRALLKRACEIAAAGRHNLLLSGPPGCGKTMAAERVVGISPELSHEQAVEVARIYSTAGLLGRKAELEKTPPVRAPHHTASVEGIIGGGRHLTPGELSLAHNGILILDEAPEFRRGVLQSLREPLERRLVRLIRAERRYWYPADVQLIMTANACPCGNYGAVGRRCLCSVGEIHNYRKRMGAALLDRVEIRVWQTEETEFSSVLEVETIDASSEAMRERVLRAVAAQHRRYKEYPFDRNGRVPGSMLPRLVKANTVAHAALEAAVPRLGLSSRAVDAILRVARSIADIDGSEEVGGLAMMEAIQLRRDDR